MRFLVDECVGSVVAEWLKNRGHEVFSVYDERRGMDDDDIIAKAFDENWILLTSDKDFGEKVYRRRRPHRGVVFLRLDDERSQNKIRVLNLLLDQYATRLPDEFVVVTERKVRFAKH
jgi:predicted nuclease of predicted toxin-antitoxin system